MLNRLASLAMSTSILKALPGKLDIKRHSPSILYFKSSWIISTYRRTTHGITITYFGSEIIYHCLQELKLLQYFIVEEGNMTRFYMKVVNCYISI